MGKNYRLEAETLHLGLKEIGTKEPISGKALAVFLWTVFLWTVFALAFVALMIIGAVRANAKDDIVTPVEKTADEFSAIGYLATGTSGDNNFCTTFYIGDGRWATAGHCVFDGSTEYRVVTNNPNGAKKTLKVFTQVYSNPGDKYGEDFGIVFTSVAAVDNAGIKGLPLLCDPWEPKLGDEVWAEGFPEDFGRARTFGYVSSVQPSPWAPGKGGWEHDVFRVQLPASYGSSGSPLFDKRTGAVVGIMVGLLPNNRTLGAVTPISVVCKVLGLTGGPVAE